MGRVRGGLGGVLRFQNDGESVCNCFALFVQSRGGVVCLFGVGVRF